ncbi:alpha-galactosidase [Longispora fulva]|uniref:Alpha-galactosidase n=1 Tax=Longispora fulva TaxID=619741 RepID=A0A8J7KPF5_9ACTN|nr:NPCBM/NEW2 domain-containing protein [Longispora fulva]MBG6136242.1 alpha-galactosidase [Longispora fulva]GIG63425.1 alpha-galactosidase [Longispora fulva]
MRKKLILAAGVLAAAFLVVPATPAAALDNGLVRTPPMGFNNWNSTGCGPDFNAAMVTGIADTYVSSGLKAAGYTYVNIDDCWALPNRDTAGNLVPDPVRFPNGIKAVADYVHAKGLKFGIYSSAGTHTCDVKGFPGALGHEQADANLWASWGVDYLKYDNCNNQGVDAKQRYTAMRDALKNTGRPIVYSICEWGANAPWEWAQGIGNSWRTTGDISDNWPTMMTIAHQNASLASYGRPGAWNDPDMLEVGNGGMTDTEYRTHFSLWAMMNAPLLIGSDLRTVSAATLNILRDRDVIALDQDPLGRSATEVTNAGGKTVMVKVLANGDRAVALVNENNRPLTITTTAAELGMGGSSAYAVKDLWTKATSTSAGVFSAVVPGHGTMLLRVTPNGRPGMPTGITQLADLPWQSATSGWGPVERNLSNGDQADGDGRTMTIGGTTYPRGLGVHAGSEIVYQLGGDCTSFTADVGVDDETGPSGSVVFQVRKDGALVADSGRRTGADPATRLTVDLTGGQELRLVATDAGDGMNWDHADWANAQVICGHGPAAGTWSLSALPWQSAAGAWGPVERDRSNGEQGPHDGHPIYIGGVYYPTGLGTNAASEIVYFLGGTCSTLGTDVGMDAEAGTRGSVVFQIYADGVKVADSGVVRGAEAARSLTANLTGAKELRLVVTDAGDGANSDHADWAGPTITC